MKSKETTSLNTSADRVESTENDNLLNEDGRSKEYQDRARINPEPDPAAKTNLERDYEPESVKEKPKDNPSY